MEAPPIDLRAYRRLLRTNRNFRLLWSAQFISEIGDWLYSVAIYSLMLELTGSARAVALAFVLQVLPQCFAAPMAGVLNDRVSRKKVMIMADWARAGITLCMIFAQTRETLWLLFILLFLETIFWAMFEPGRTAVVPNITKGAETLVANGLSAMTWSFTLAIGSAVGGTLAAFFGRNTVFVLNSLSFVASALLLTRMQFAEPYTADLPALRPKDLFDFTPILDGARYVLRDARLSALIFIKAGLSFMGTNWVLLPIFGRYVFPLTVPGLDAKSAGMLGMSVLMGSRGMGALIGPLVASRFAHTSEKRYRIGILFGFLIGSLGYLALSFAPSMPVACAAVVLAHSGGAITWVFSTTLMQMHSDDRFRGRVFSAEFAFHMLVLSCVTYSAGVLSDAGVPVRTLAFITSMMILIPALLWAFALRLWRTEMGTHRVRNEPR